MRRFLWCVAWVAGCAGATDPMLDIDAAELAPPTPPAPSAVEPSAGWPHRAATLRALRPAPPTGFERKRVFIDAGHGEPGNIGNKGAFCQLEQDFTLALARDLAGRLRSLGPFDVKVSRQGSERPRYPQRVAVAEGWEADAYLSLHSDNRGRGSPWQAAPGMSCVHDETSPGFSVLWSDVAPAPLKAARRRLARSTSIALGQAGFLPCSCEEYVASYAADTVPGVFVDRHRRARRIFVLERTRVPSILIETHNAWDRDEVARWSEEATFEAFAHAVAAGLFEALGSNRR